MKDHLSVNEAAERLDVSVYTIRNYLRSGKLGYVRVGGGRYRIPESAIAAFLAKGTRMPGASNREIADAIRVIVQGAPDLTNDQITRLRGVLAEPTEGRVAA